MKVIFLSLCLTLSISAHAQSSCPVKMGKSGYDYLEKVAALATKASSCAKASEIVTACAMGTSGDYKIAYAASARCEKFMPKMSEKDTEAYDYMHGKCNEKYDPNESMNKSSSAFCHLSVVKVFVDILPEE